MRYIEADALKEHMLKYGFHSVDQTVTEFVEDTLPTADVVEVIRCKDCKYRKFVDFGMGDCLHPKGSKHIAFDYHYCSYGERREEIDGCD